MMLPRLCPIIAVLGLGAATLRGADPVQDAIAKAAGQNPQAAIQTLADADRLHPGQPELLARLSLAWSEEVSAARKRKEKDAAKAAALQAVDLAQKAVAAGPQSAKAHLALSVAYGRQTDFVDNSTKMALSQKIRAEAERSIAFDPSNPIPYEILGRWKYGFATLNPVMRVAAKMAYGTLPNPSLEEAAQDLEKAAALNPKRISPYRQLAIIYKAQKQPEKAAQAWKKVLSLTPEDDDDRAYQAEARAALR